MVYLVLGIFLVTIATILFFTTRYFWLLLKPARRQRWGFSCRSIISVQDKGLDNL